MEMISYQRCGNDTYQRCGNDTYQRCGNDTLFHVVIMIELNNMLKVLRKVFYTL